MRFNKDFWAAKTLQGITDRKKREYQERARQRCEELALERLADELEVVEYSGLMINSCNNLNLWK